MKGIAFLSGLISSLLTSGITLPAIAQVSSDGTTNTTVNSTNNNFNILNGIQKGNNLFHSFKEFSIPTGGSATFDLTNTSNINTIFSRVTGGNVSNIDGLIQTLNSSNPVSLFLMNPNGIIFGKNASLNVGGSFIGTTAESIKFSDGTEFSAVNPSEPPLLTISVPVGLQMGTNAAAIEVQGTPANNFFFRTPTLSTAANQTLALVGGQVDINSANISAPDSRQLNIKELSELLRNRQNRQSQNIDLLVLSACDTAAGDNRAVLGLAGLAVKSGARSTIASL